MPLRLPARRKADAGEAPPFKRRTPPTPQATRLMRVSLAAGLLFLVVLGIVFVPIALRYGGVQPPVVTFRLAATGPVYTVNVSSVSSALALSSYRADVNGTGLAASCAIDPLAANASACGGDLTFTDADRDGRLSVGDSFSFRPPTGSGRWLLELFNDVRDEGAKPPCPCAVGYLWFP